MATKRPYWIVPRKKIDVHVYVIVYCLCAKFEQNQFRDVWVMVQRHVKSQQKMAVSGHIGSYCKINWCARVCHSELVFVSSLNKIGAGTFELWLKDMKNRIKMTACWPFGSYRKIDVHLYVLVHCLCAKSEQNRCRDVWVITMARLAAILDRSAK